jgi:hypothetical protein
MITALRKTLVKENVRFAERIVVERGCRQEVTLSVT